METPEQRLTIRRGDRVRLPHDHPTYPGRKGTVVFCGTYQVRVRIHDANAETWAFSNDLEIL